MKSLKEYLVVLSLLFISACSSTSNSSSIVLNYQDFGPPSAAFNLIGNDWWQWDSHGDSRPRKYDIKVVVFKDINEKTVREIYPVDQATEKDFRYLSYDAALNYLHEMIEENAVPSLTEKLRDTRMKLKDFFKDEA